MQIQNQTKMEFPNSPIKPEFFVPFTDTKKPQNSQEPTKNLRSSFDE